MFAIALILLALAGGAAGTYFLMDAPRRRAVERRAALDRERRALDRGRDRHDDEVRRHEERERQLAAAVASNERWAGDLSARETEFVRRAIAYEDLGAENRILRTDLKNAAVHAAYLEQLHHANRSGASTAADRRDRLGRAYFDEAAAAARKALTPGTYPTHKQRVRNAADRVRAEGADLSEAEVEKALAGLHEVFERAVRAAVEREEQARQKEVEAAEAAVEQAERERAAVEVALARALASAAGHHAAEVDALRAQLAEAEAKSQRAVSLAQVTKAGHVYVISNVGSFGPGVFKIGMTRRREPQDRVDELGDASVPFPFDVHAMIRCADAPGLEAALHQQFRAQRVNRVNLRKEFFRVTIDEIVAAVRDHHGEVEYRADAEALEYLGSRNATDADRAEIEQAYAAAGAAVQPAAGANQ